MAENFTIDGRLKNLPDIQRQYNFELLIPDIGDVREDDLILRVRSASIPSRGNTPIESVFMGMKQFYPGQPLFGNTLAVQFEEFEDQKTLTQLYDWSQKIFNIDPDNPNGGHSEESSKRDVVRDITLRMYSYNGEKLDKQIKFYNSFIQNIADSALAYATNDSIKLDVTFQFDYWKLVNA